MSRNDDSNIIPFPGTESAGALQIRIDLMLMPWPVWRRMLVPDTCDFWALHVAIQDVMGWEDRHLHQFTVDEPRHGERLRFGIPDESGFYGAHEVLTGWEHRVRPYVEVGGHPLLYTYNFGDFWQHELNLEAELTGQDALALPRCLDGQGRCPAENSGGPGALGRPADPDLFEPEQVMFDNPRIRWRRSFGHD